MVSSKRHINYLTFIIIIIIVIIIVIEISNASECLDKITKIGKIKKDFNGTQAFQHVFSSIRWKKISKAKNKTVLHKYIDDLYDAAIVIYKDDMIINPMDWCMESIRSYIVLEKNDDDEEKCNFYLKKVYDEDVINDAKKALKYTYYNVVPTASVNAAVRGYHKYMLNTFLPHVVKTNVQGPIEYCNNIDHITLLFENISNENQTNDDHSTNLYQPDNNQEYDEESLSDYFDLEIPEDHLYPTLESIFEAEQFNPIVTDHTDVYPNQPDFFSAQDPGENWNYNIPPVFTPTADYSHVPEYYQNPTLEPDFFTNQNDPITADQFGQTDQINPINTDHTGFYYDQPGHFSAQSPGENWDYDLSSISISDAGNSHVPEYYQNPTLQPDFFTNQNDPITADQFGQTDQINPINTDHPEFYNNQPDYSSTQVPREFWNFDSPFEPKISADYLQVPEYFEDPTLQPTFFTNQYDPVTVDQFGQPDIPNLEQLPNADQLSSLPPSSSSASYQDYSYDIDYIPHG